MAWVAALAALLGRRSPRVLAVACAFPGGVFLGVALTGMAVFRTTAAATWGVLVLAGALWLLTFGRVLANSRWSICGLVVGVVTGSVQLSSHRPPQAATRPLARELPEGTVDTSSTLEFVCGPGRLEVTPLLELTATSRDGFWPGVSTADVLEGTPALEGTTRRARLAHTQEAWTAFVAVPHAVAAHLTRFTRLRLHGAQQPRLGLGDAVFDFLPFDYPHGRPAQFAFVRGQVLTVARGRDAEKGPFTTLAAVALRDEVLRLTFFDGPTAWCTVEFDDFIPQADVDNQSPTAGEGVAPNVIQFGFPGAAVVPTVHLSLAETGIGAGRDTVLHAPGVYRNRAHVTQH